MPVWVKNLHSQMVVHELNISVEAKQVYDPINHTDKASDLKATLKHRNIHMKPPEAISF